MALAALAALPDLLDFVGGMISVDEGRTKLLERLGELRLIPKRWEEALDGCKANEAGDTARQVEAAVRWSSRDAEDDTSMQLRMQRWTRGLWSDGKVQTRQRPRSRLNSDWSRLWFRK